MAKKTSVHAAKETEAASQSWIHSPWVKEAAAILALYVVTLILFWPFVVKEHRFSASGDSASAKAWADVSEEIADTEHVVPTWNPYVFTGFPSYGSLSYHPALPYNPVEIVAKVGRYLFGPYHTNKEIFYFFISGVFMYLFARGVGIPLWGALLAGMVFLLNPYNVSLMTAAHGSKHWTIAMMPLVFLMTHRVLTKRRIVDGVLLALAFASSLLSLHVQIAYYTVLISGLYALDWIIKEAFKNRANAGKALGTYAGAGVFGLALSAYLYLPVYIYSKFSIRGMSALKAADGPAGLDWSYATAWSLHPLEALQFFVPTLYGLGGLKGPDQALIAGRADLMDYNLYWGWMPFTMSSLYMGIIPLLLALVAIVLLWKREGVVRWMTISGVAALFVSFGNFLPVLYKPLYNFLPFFNKFRVPSMALVVVAVAVALLAGFGLREVIGWMKKNDRKARTFFLAISGVAVVGMIVAWIWGVGNGPTAESGWFQKAGEIDRYGDPRIVGILAQLRWKMFLKGLIQTSLYTLVFAGVGYVLVSFKGVRKYVVYLGAAAFLLTSVDLLVLDGRFLDPVKMTNFKRALAPTATVKYLQQEEKKSDEPFRIFPLGNEFQNNTWMYHRIQSVGGYAAVKLRQYQDMLDYGIKLNSRGQLPDLKLAGMMNGNYVVSPVELPFTEVFKDPSGRQRVYKNPFAMPRAWFVDFVKVEKDGAKVMDEIADPGFNPAQLAIIMEDPKFPIGKPDTLSSAVMPKEAYKAHGFDVEVSTPDDGFLVVSEMYYPQGWEATIDGEPTHIYRTNYSLRGIAVPSGEHTVRFEFHPPEIRAGLVVSSVSGIVLALLLFWQGALWWRRRGAAE